MICQYPNSNPPKAQKSSPKSKISEVCSTRGSTTLHKCTGPAIKSVRLWKYYVIRKGMRGRLWKCWWRIESCWIVLLPQLLRHMRSWLARKTLPTHQTPKARQLHQTHLIHKANVKPKKLSFHLRWLMNLLHNQTSRSNSKPQSTISTTSQSPPMFQSFKTSEKTPGCSRNSPMSNCYISHPLTPIWS